MKYQKQDDDSVGEVNQIIDDDIDALQLNFSPFILFPLKSAPVQHCA